MEQALIENDIYDINYDNYQTLKSILTNPSFNPNVILKSRGMQLPAWVWVLFNSNDPNISHYVLNNVNITIDQNVNNQFVLDIAKNKDKSLYERLRKYIGPLVGLEQASFIQLPYGLMDIIQGYAEQHSWEHIKLYNTIVPSNRKDNELKTLCVYKNILCIARSMTIYVYDLDKYEYLDESYDFFNGSVQNMKLYENTLICGCPGHYVEIHRQTGTKSMYFISQNNFDPQVAINDKYIVAAINFVKVMDKNTNSKIREYSEYSDYPARSVSLDNDILCVSYNTGAYIFNIRNNIQMAYKGILLQNGFIRKICIHGDTIMISTSSKKNIFDIRIYKIDLQDSLNNFPYTTSLGNPVNIIDNVYSGDSISLDFDDKIIMSSDDKVVKIWNRNTLKLIKEIQDGDTFKSVLLHNNSIICGLDNGEVKIYK